MTRIRDLSPLLTRDLNKEPSRTEADSNAIQHPQDDNVSVEEIKARFDRDFLPKYGSLWRQIIREKESRDRISIDDNQVAENLGSLEPTLPNPRALNFLEAIERKQAVSISAAEECECPPAVVEFVELNKEQTKNITMDRKKRRSYKSHDIPSEDSIGFETLQNSRESSDEETETEVEDDMESVYETADEFELEDDKRSIGMTENIENGSHAEDKVKQSKIPIITIDSDSDDMEDYKTKVVNFRNGTGAASRKIDDDDDDEVENDRTHESKLHISTKESENEGIKFDPIGPDDTTCLSPRLVEEGSSSDKENDPFLDTDDEADDEYDSESEDEEDEAEWLPDDESILSSPKSKSPLKEKVQKRRVEKRANSQTINPKPKPKATKETDKTISAKGMIKKTIDLCDTSSSDDSFDSDFTVSTDDDKGSKNEELNVPANIRNIQQKGKSKASFKRNREQITKAAFEEFNRKAFGGRLGKVVVEWSKKLNTTAGLTRLQKVSTNMTPGVPLQRLATIELSTKVVDSEEKLRTTLLHELVHAAVWIFEGVSKPPHGADFKRWAKIAMSKVPDVKVTTTHSYQIQYRFNWACVNPKCSFTIGRHSKSVDLVRHRCGKCRGKLMEITANGKPKKPAQPSAYNLFVKQHSKAVREQLAKRKAGVTQAEVMKELGRLWREKKEQSAKASANQ